MAANKNAVSWEHHYWLASCHLREARMGAAHGCLALVQLILAKVCIVNSNLVSIVGHGVILLLLGEIVFIVLVTRRKDVDHCLGRPKVNAVLVHLAQQKKVVRRC